MFSNRTSTLLIAAMASGLVSTTGAAVTAAAQATEPPSQPAEPASAIERNDLGTVDFPTTCSSEAQARFLRGVAALHSFWYPVAIDEFRASTRLDPGCMMGSWGEAMAHDHPIWGDPQQTESARGVIEKMRATPDLTPRERDWLGAVKLLYGEGDEAARDRAYAEAMERMHRAYPGDDEAALFYALALMGAAAGENSGGLRSRLRAGEIASAVFEKRPDHPGAAHYVIHAYDDPEHAELALDAARRYAEIAPSAPHALHMPSHIFLQLGMWPEAAASNEASWAASDDWVDERDLPVSQRDYHSLHWLMYVYLQQGRYDEAAEALARMRRSLARFPEDAMRELMFGTYTHAMMAASFLAETERWDEAGTWLPPAEPKAPSSRTDGGAEARRAFAAVAQIPALYARGLAAAAKGSPAARKSVDALRASREKASAAAAPFLERVIGMIEIHELQIDAVAAVARNDFDAAIEKLRNAASREEEMPPPSGPPLAVKPSHELLGETLLAAGRPKEASEAFATSLERHTNRARSLLGAARAARESGDARHARAFYEKFVEQWREADPRAPELHEARDFLKNEKTSVLRDP